VISLPSVWAPVAEEDNAVAEGPGLGGAESDVGIESWEQGLAVSNDDRVDVDPVLVDQVVSYEGCGELGPAQRQVPAGLP
jgi:hypothetical protein